MSARIKGEDRAASAEQQQDAKYQLRSSREGGHKPQSEATPTQDGKKKSAAVRRRPAANQGGVKERLSGAALTARSTSGSAAGTPGPVPQEEEEAMSRKWKPIRKHRTMAVAAASQPGGAEEPQHAGVRRSKRIINRK